MIKKLFKIIVILVASIIALYFTSYLFQNYQFISKYNKLIDSVLLEEDKIMAKYTVIRCNYDILNPEFVYISGKIDPLINFYKPPVFLKGDLKDSLEFRTGGTTVYNTTFPELVEMVKEDCSQFQQSYTDYTGYEDLTEGERYNQWSEIAEKNLYWTYTPAETKEDKADDIKYHYLKEESYKIVFREIYGDIYKMTDDEVIAVYERIQEEGLDPRVQIVMDASDITKELSEFNTAQQNKIKKYYGDWEELTYEELIEWATVITADINEGKFKLIED